LGWYSRQDWGGIALADLVPSIHRSGVIGIAFGSVTGYRKVLPIEEARQALLTTHVGGEVLDHLHGFPLRLVAPTRRGWYWVKWLSTIEPLSLAAFQRWSEK
jgi:DMSO/TMAO reductase YedYZ molybdopterin-dependent catalytic subunit